jgi:type II secretory pathway pseudopilin PulG
MSDRLRLRLGAEHGSSLVGTLLSLVAVAVLAVVLLPSLMGGSSKKEQAQMSSATAQANDVQATSLLGNAQTAMATYQASGNGFAGATPATLHSLDPEIPIAGPGQAYLQAVSATDNAYMLVAYNPLTGNSFTLADNNGAVTKTCTVAGRGGCQPGGTW